MNAQFLQDLAESIGLGDNVSYEDLSSFSGQDIATALIGSYDIDPDLLPSTLFTGITPGMMEGTYGKTYSPIIQAKQNPLITSLTKSVEGKQGAAAYGGFADSYASEAFEQGARDVYGKGMTDILTGVGASKSQSFQNIFDLMTSWKETAQDIRYQ